MFIGWYDPDKRKPARLKVLEAADRYTEKFGGTPLSCLTSIVDAEELHRDQAAPEIEIKGVHYIPRYTFYIGQEDQ